MSKITEDKTATYTYRKGSLTMQKNHRGNMVLEHATLENSDSFSPNSDVVLDVSGLRLTGEEEKTENNPYDSRPADTVAEHWNKGFIR